LNEWTWGNLVPGLMPFSAGAVAPLGSAIGGASMGACGNRVGMRVEVEFVERGRKRMSWRRKEEEGRKEEGGIES
jgi:hypothetical protein